MIPGIGYTMVLIGAIISTYYNVIIAFTVFYFFASFNSKLPWMECHESWQTIGCTNIAGNGKCTYYLNNSCAKKGNLNIYPLPLKRSNRKCL